MEYDNKNYVNLKNISEKYKLGCCLVACICKTKINAGSVQEELRNGSFVMTDNDYKRTSDLCSYVSNFREIQKKIGGRSELFYGAVAWIASQKGVNRERLFTSVVQQSNTMTPAAKAELILKEISEIYNKGYAKNNRRYFDYEWRTKDDAKE